MLSFLLLGFLRDRAFDIFLFFLFDVLLACRFHSLTSYDISFRYIEWRMEIAAVATLVMSRKNMKKKGINAAYR